MEPDSWLERYRGSEQVEVWAELVALGPGVRGELFEAHAVEVARETMTRVRRNIEMLVERLRGIGYEFQHRRPHVPPHDVLRRQISDIEARFGPIPVSLRIFYDVVGTVDLTQSWDQLVHWYRPERDSASDLEVLGEYDPLVVEAIYYDEEAPPGWFCFAADEFHKANYSGGENYHVVLPDSAADFRIVGCTTSTSSSSHTCGRRSPTADFADGSTRTTIAAGRSRRNSV